ncbi:MAG: UbiA family prenyltransferase [Desulforhopalus sp.]
MISRLELAKVPLCLLIGCSTVFGYILADPAAGRRTFFLGVGIFVIAAGAATLNSLQEHGLDRQLERTKNRPLPKGLLTPGQAWRQAMILLCIGFMILVAASENFLPVLVALFSLFLYNVVYTPLKKKTILAIIPGAICGALPPYIGWIGGGGEAAGYTGMLLIVLFVLWQVPHYWLVLLTFKEDYEKSDIPNFLKQYKEESLKRFFVSWIGALASVMLMFLLLPFHLWPFSRVLILLNVGLLLFVFFYSFIIQNACNYRILFIFLNIALFFHMVVLSMSRFFA